MTWECAGQLRTLVTSMNEHLDGSQELVVVDNASSDRPDEPAAAWKGRQRFIGLDRNQGFGAASNIGVAEAGEPTTVLLNPDTELLDAGLDRLAVAARELDALVGPRLLNSDHTPQPSASGPEIGPWPWLRAVLPGSLQPAVLQARTEPYRLERPTPVTWLTGACIAAPTALLRRLGPFDPALHLYGEDVDLGLRAAVSGHLCLFDPTACRIVHHGQASSTRFYGTREGWKPVGTLHWRAVLRRAYGPRREWLAWRALRLNLRLRVIAKTLTGRDAKGDSEALAAARAADPPPELTAPHTFGPEPAP